MLAQLQAAVESMTIPDRKRGNVVRKTLLAATNFIYAWKQHIVRRSRAESRKRKVIAEMDADECFFTMDWSMKVQTPWKYKERQGEWFGKSGTSIHISHAMKKTDEGYKYMVFVHILNNKDEQSADGRKKSQYLIVAPELQLQCQDPSAAYIRDQLHKSVGHVASRA